MKKVKKYRGITLVEVLISLILIGIISAGLLTFFAGSFNNILRQRGQNTTNFDIQEAFETELAEIKKNGGQGTDVEAFNYKIGSGNTQNINVTGKILSYKDNKIKNIHLFAANVSETMLELPSDLAVSIQNSKGFYYVGETTPAGTAGLKDNKQDSRTRIYTESGWFLSDRSIGSGATGIVPVGTIGTLGDNSVSQLVLPEMPTDFRQQSNQESGIYIKDNMRGRFLTFAARAINSYGRVGSYQEAKNRIWVMGLPEVENGYQYLDVHTDADLAVLSSDNKKKIRIPTDNKLYTNVEVLNYKRPTDIPYSNISVLSYYEDIIKQSRQFIALRDSQDDQRQSKQEMAFTRDFSDSKSYTTSILIGNRNQSGKLLTYKFDNTLTWGINLQADGNLNFITTGTGEIASDGQQTSSVKIDYSKDNSIQVRSSTIGKKVNIEVFVNGTLIHSQIIPLNDHDAQRAQIVFGGNTYINEFAIYTKALRDTDINKLAVYFRDKYKAS
ncbi:hypothetical protein HMPREF9383_0081 [Streptococcus sanguinis SK150]|uniref:Uncharacterized protein n=1 Tax=Streptococcus sanguinis SK150 TaxID=888811 RepID=F0IJ06_STRSA|nr:prepilin-type N-terminal cleavage/methylation domain-containing protein [Streptococcus sanguinis]EGD37587.1 hypothetical protein HMPREF9383_0081 [Streptococcus sanguinis SK150]RKW02366.1 MAG: type II secretion system protein [Streptococcus sp.]